MDLKLAGNDFTATDGADDTDGDLKRCVGESTINELPQDRKLLKVAKEPARDSVLLWLYRSPGSRWETIPVISLMGSSKLEISEMISTMDTVKDEIVVDPLDSTKILRDIELGEHVNIQQVDIEDWVVNITNLSSLMFEFKLRVNMQKLNLLNPPRRGKNLLVLDIEYTLVAHHSPWTNNSNENMRPYLHEFISASYSAYDIIIWSATCMTRVREKMKYLGVLDNPNYKITALIDHHSLMPFQSETRETFLCKPLGVIWTTCREFYHTGNTIMVDDQTNNFAMNPQNGLTIKPFQDAHLNRYTDNELVGLMKDGVSTHFLRPTKLAEEIPDSITGGHTGVMQCEVTTE